MVNEGSGGKRQMDCWRDTGSQAEFAQCMNERSPFRKVPPPGPSNIITRTPSPLGSPRDVTSQGKLSPWDVVFAFVIIAVVAGLLLLLTKV